MTDLTKALRQLEPLARALVVLAGQATDLEKLGTRVNELQGNFEQRQGEWEAAEAAMAKAKTAVVEANAQVIAAQRRSEQMAEDAATRAKQMLAEAGEEAEADAKMITASFKAEHADWKAKISEAKQTLARLEGDIVERRKAHDAVLDSIASLSKRLVGAS